MSLSVPRIAVARCVSFLTADVCAGFRVAVPAHAFLVIDSAVCVQPNDNVSRAMRLRGNLAAEKLKRAYRNRRTRRRLVL